jgi:hypothetical protein
LDGFDRARFAWNAGGAYWLSEAESGWFNVMDVNKETVEEIKRLQSQLKERKAYVKKHTGDEEAVRELRTLQRRINDLEGRKNVLAG